MNKKRKYSETDLQIGFTCTISNDLDIPACVLCQKSLENDLTKPNVLAQHLNIAYSEFKLKDLDFFKGREAVFKKQRLDKGGIFFQQTSEGSL